MKLPKKLKIAGRDIKIIYPHTFTERDLYGQFTEILGIIQIANKGFQGVHLCEDVIQTSFWHEILHAIDAMYNNDSLTEEQVDRLSKGFYQVLKDNFSYSPLRTK